MAARAETELEDDDFFFGDADDELDTEAEKERGTKKRREKTGKTDREPGHRAKPVPVLQRFKTWRKQRPFIPGLLLILSGIIMLAPAYFTFQVSDLLVMIATISGVSTLLIGAVLIMFGIGMWLQPYAAPYLGVLGILVAIVAVPTSNLGGFFIGSLLGIFGGALGLAWEKDGEKRGAKHAKRKHSQAPPGDNGAGPRPECEDEDEVAGATLIDEFPAGIRTREPRGGSTKIDLSRFTSPKSVAVILAGAGLVMTQVGQEPAVNAQEPARLQANLPQLSAPPSLPVPQLPAPPTNLPQPPDPRDMLTYPDLEPTRTIAPQNIGTVTADHVAITGNVHATIGMINVGDVPTRTLILTGDRLTAKNLSLEVPGFAARGMLTTGQVETKVSGGPVQVVATGLTATPKVAGVPTVPVTADLRGPLGDLLAQLGVPNAHPVPNVPVPNFVMEAISLGNVTMQMVSLDGMHLHAPAVQLRVPK